MRMITHKYRCRKKVTTSMVHDHGAQIFTLKASVNCRTVRSTIFYPHFKGTRAMSATAMSAWFASRYKTSPMGGPPEKS